MNNEQILEIAEKCGINQFTDDHKERLLAFAHELLETQKRKCNLAVAGGEAVAFAWAYEFHEFGDVWKRHVILNNPYGTANPPTKHNGNEIRNVQTLYTTPRIPEGMKLVPIEPTDESLLKPINSPIRCHCPPDKCNAPVIMGRQTPCLRKSAPTKD